MKGPYRWDLSFKINHFLLFGCHYAPRILNRESWLRQALVLIAFMIAPFISLGILESTSCVCVWVAIFIMFMELPLFISVDKGMDYKYVNKIITISPYISKILLAFSVMATIKNLKYSKYILGFEISISVIMMLILIVGACKSKQNFIIRKDKSLHIASNKLVYQRKDINRLALRWLNNQKINVYKLPQDYSYLMKRNGNYKLYYLKHGYRFRVKQCELHK